MTNGWVDIKNTDMMLIMGGNPAECHPCGFKWVLEAKRNRNAKLIVVDPRFTRTASTSDLFCQIRAGSDIAFLGGLIRYAIENNRYAKEYLVNYTNAAFIIKEGFKLPDDGLYSGFDPEKKTYDKSTWNYQEGGDMGGKPTAVAAAVPGKTSHPTKPHESLRPVEPGELGCFWSRRSQRPATAMRVKQRTKRATDIKLPAPPARKLQPLRVFRQALPTI